MFLDLHFVFKNATCFAVKWALDQDLLASFKMYACICVTEPLWTVSTFVLVVFQIVSQISTHLVWFILYSAVWTGRAFLKPQIEAVRTVESLTARALLRVPHHSVANIADKVLLDRLHALVQVEYHFKGIKGWVIRHFTQDLHDSNHISRESCFYHIY